MINLFSLPTDISSACPSKVNATFVEIDTSTLDGNVDLVFEWGFCTWDESAVPRPTYKPKEPTYSESHVVSAASLIVDGFEFSINTAEVEAAKAGQEFPNILWLAIKRDEESESDTFEGNIFVQSEHHS